MVSAGLDAHPAFFKIRKVPFAEIFHESSEWDGPGIAGVFFQVKLPANCRKGAWRAAGMLSSALTKTIIVDRLGYPSMSAHYLKVRVTIEPPWYRTVCQAWKGD